MATLETMKTKGTKAIVSVPGWVEGLATTDKVTSTSQAYAYVPLIHRAVQLRCDAISSVPVFIKHGDTEVAWPWPDKSISRMIWQTEVALLLAGAAYWLKLSNTQSVKSLQWLNPFTVDVNYIIGANNVVDLTFTQSHVTNQNIWTEDEIVYFKEFNPGDDIGPGVAATAVALSDAQALRYMTRFAAYFFEGGAMPVTLLSVEGGIGEDEAKRMENFFKRSMTGIANAWRVLAVRNIVEPKVITPDIKDMAMPELSEESRHNIALAFGIPYSMLADADNRATAGTNRKSFWQDTIRPRGMLIEEVINSQLLADRGLELHFAFDQLDVFQEDEAERAGSLQQLTMSGVPLQMAMDLLGYDMTEEQRDELENDEVFEEEITVETSRTPEDDELDKWERVAKKRVGKQKVFVSDIIEPSLLEAIQGQLEDAETVDEVKAIFESVRVWRNYP